MQLSSDRSGIGVNAAADTGDMSPATFGFPGIQYIFGPRQIISIRNIK